MISRNTWKAKYVLQDQGVFLADVGGKHWRLHRKLTGVKHQGLSSGRTGGREVTNKRIKEAKVGVDDRWD